MSYWSERQKQLKAYAAKEEERYMKRVTAYYEAELKRLERQIAAYYAAYGEENVIAYRNLLQTLPADDARLLIEQIDEFVKKYPQYADLVPVRETIYRLNRLEGLQYSIRMAEANIAGYADDLMTPYLTELSRRGVNDGMETLGFGKNFYSINSDIVKQFVGVPWCNGENFSTRIWNDTQKLAETLNQQIAQGFARGDSYERLTKQLQDRFKRVNKRDAYRLIYTEGTYVMAESSMQPFTQDFQKYRIVTAEDNRVCPVCSGISSEVFEIEDRQPGTNFPPFHPYCRCTFTVVVEDWGAWLDDYVARHEAAESAKQAEAIASHIGGESAKRQLRFSLDIQSFAKRSRNYGRIKLTTSERLRVESELNTWLRHDEVIGTVTEKAIGDYIYTVEVNGFNDYTFLDKQPIDGDWSKAIKRRKKR